MELRTVFIVVFCLATVNAKTFRKCDLARELIEKHKFSRTMLSSWMCMIEAESNFNTKKTAKYPPNAFEWIYTSYGLFQINDKNYCGKGKIGGKCKIRCEELLSDDITKAAQCAQIVLNTEGFKAWKGWEVRCKPNIGHLPPYNECFKPTAVAG